MGVKNRGVKKKGQTVGTKPIEVTEKNYITCVIIYRIIMQARMRLFPVNLHCCTFLNRVYLPVLLTSWPEAKACDLRVNIDSRGFVSCDETEVITKIVLTNKILGARTACPLI